jgi:integrase
VTRGTIAPSTVKRELNLLKRVIDYRRRWLGIQLNPVNAQDVKRPTVQDERDVRLSEEEREVLMEACRSAHNSLRPLSSWASIRARGAAISCGWNGRM